MRRIARGVRRIIPARAGFTVISMITPPRCRGSSPLARGLLYWEQGLDCTALDHPRSRGVYPAGPPSSTSASGSSPLARGLHEIGAVAHGDDRIIPARAGFTHHPKGRLKMNRDHPRSRGVYAAKFALYVGGTRIIPARAGFTVQGQGRGRQARDHPRSRGVYALAAMCVLLLGGSSPLARGLQKALGRVVVKMRIIPARAGFT